MNRSIDIDEAAAIAHQNGGVAVLAPEGAHNVEAFFVLPGKMREFVEGDGRRAAAASARQAFQRNPAPLPKTRGARKRRARLRALNEEREREQLRARRRHQHEMNKIRKDALRASGRRAKRKPSVTW